jgi:hypothetical protein
MYWICYIILPCIVAWKKRSDNFVKAFYSFFGTMVSAYLAVWCESLVRHSITSLVPPDKVMVPWLAAGAMAVIWFITAVALCKVLEMIQPEGVEIYSISPKVEKYLTPVTVFFHTGLVIALLFTILSVSPVKRYAPFVFENPSLCSAARYRFLWSSFIIDRFSFQSTSVTERRRAFDRFVPADPSKVSQPVPRKKR